VLIVYARGPDDRIAKAADPAAALASGRAVWIDMLDVGADEEQRVETLLGIDVPTSAERAALEDSARLYEDSGALVLTATIIASRAGGAFAADGVSFVLAKSRLVTVRHIDTRAFQIGADRASVRLQNAANGGEVLMALLESILERLADVLQEASTRAQTVSQGVFVTDKRGPNMEEVLSELGRLGSVVTLAHESLSSLERLFSFAQDVCTPHGLSGPRLAALGRDAHQLERTAEALQNHLTFLLDATLGLVASAQNASLARLSTAAMVFVPSTLIAGIFGMNFKAMTIFDAPWGPWAAFALMIVSMIAALSFARYRKWI
jgi:magnesium transporter